MASMVKEAAGTFASRFMYFLLHAVGAGLLANIFVQYAIKEKNIDRFILDNMIAYGQEMLTMFMTLDRVVVIVAAVLISAFVQTLIIFNLEKYAVKPTAKAAGIGAGLTWSARILRSPFRGMHWIFHSIHRLMTGWVWVIAFVAFNPTTPILLDEFLKDVWAPVTILTRSDTRIGFIIFLVLTGVMFAMIGVNFRQPMQKWAEGNGIKPKKKMSTEAESSEGELSSASDTERTPVGPVLIEADSESGGEVVVPDAEVSVATRLVPYNYDPEHDEEKPSRFKFWARQPKHKPLPLELVPSNYQYTLWREIPVETKAV